MYIIMTMTNKYFYRIVMMTIAWLTTSLVYAQDTTDESPVKVNYRKGYQWYDAHDNLTIRTRAYVYRDKTYADGRSETDIIGEPYPIFFGGDVSNSGTYNGTDDYWHNGQIYGITYSGERVYLGEQQVDGIGDRSRTYREMIINDDTYCILYSKTGVPDLSRVSWEEPRVSIDFHRDKSFYKRNGRDEYFNFENPMEAWYFDYYWIQGRNTLSLTSSEGQSEFFRLPVVSWELIDRFLYIDGQIIDFDEYLASGDVDFRVEEITMEDGRPAKVFTLDLQIKYMMDRVLYLASVDTVYQMSQEEIHRMPSPPKSVTNPKIDFIGDHPATSSNVAIKPEE